MKNLKRIVSQEYTISPNGTNVRRDTDPAVHRKNATELTKVYVAVPIGESELNPRYGTNCDKNIVVERNPRTATGLKSMRQFASDTHMQKKGWA